jgi:hypothetical protein
MGARVPEEPGSPGSTFLPCCLEALAKCKQDPNPTRQQWQGNFPSWQHQWMPSEEPRTPSLRAPAGSQSYHIKSVPIRWHQTAKEALFIPPIPLLAQFKGQVGISSQDPCHKAGSWEPLSLQPVVSEESQWDMCQDMCHSLLTRYQQRMQTGTPLSP